MQCSRLDLGERFDKENSVKLRSTLICCAVAVLLLAGCQQASDWQEYKSTEGRFSVLMPSVPEERKQTVNTPVGPIDQHVAILSPDKNTAYLASYADYPESATQGVKPDQILDGSRDGSVANIQGKLLSELIITLGDYPGREIRVAFPDDIHTMRMRIYIVGSRLYQVGVLTTKENVSNNSVTKFLDSFKLVEN